MGSVTTGPAGSQASVTNSGTQQDAVFDFVIPKGDTGDTGTCQCPAEVCTGYSIPPQAGNTGTKFIFDRNAVQYGTGIIHSPGSTDFKIQEPGLYYVAFNGSLAPGTGTKLPLSITVYLQENGAALNGAGARCTFHNAAEVGNVAFSTALLVTTVPSVVTVIGDGGKYFYSDISLTIYKIGTLD